MLLITAQLVRQTTDAVTSASSADVRYHQL